MSLSFVIIYLKKLFWNFFPSHEAKVATAIVLEANVKNINSPSFLESYNFNLLFEESDFDTKDEYLNYFLSKYRLVRVYNLFDRYKDYILPLKFNKEVKSKNNKVELANFCTLLGKFKSWPFPSGTAYPPMFS